jgi:hypothetical protein
LADDGKVYAEPTFQLLPVTESFPLALRALIPADQKLVEIGL